MSEGAQGIEEGKWISEAEIISHIPVESDRVEENNVRRSQQADDGPISEGESPSYSVQ